MAQTFERHLHLFRNTSCEVCELVILAGRLPMVAVETGGAVVKQRAWRGPISHRRCVRECPTMRALEHANVGASERAKAGGGQVPGRALGRRPPAAGVRTDASACRAGESRVGTSMRGCRSHACLGQPRHIAMPDKAKALQASNHTSPLVPRPRPVGLRVFPPPVADAVSYDALTKLVDGNAVVRKRFDKWVCCVTSGGFVNEWNHFSSVGGLLHWTDFVSGQVSFLDRFR
eukprot:6202223-Pleurochrysis_carterae.AAC.1